MNIVYGVAGEGLGHSSRASAIISHLEKKGHKVLILTYGKAYPVLKYRFNTLKINGIRLKFDKRKLSLTKTFTYNLKRFTKNFGSFSQINKKIKSFCPDVFITDFEPFTSILSNYYKKPLISIDNQHLMNHIDMNFPKEFKKSYNITKYATHFCVPKADYFIIFSFFKMKSKYKDSFIVSPILRKEITEKRPKNGKFILVYLTKSDKEVIKLLRNIKENFVVYGTGMKKKEENIIFKKISKKFVEDLKNSKAVIATAGFSLISESIYLKKPYFAIPLKDHFEQTLNALYIEKSNFGVYSEHPDKEELLLFLNNLNFYKNSLKKSRLQPDESLNVIDKILKDLSTHL